MRLIASSWFKVTGTYQLPYFLDYFPWVLLIWDRTYPWVWLHTRVGTIWGRVLQLKRVLACGLNWNQGNTVYAHRHWMLCSLLLSGNTRVHIPSSLSPFIPVCIPLSPSSTFLSPISAPLWLSSAPPPPPSSPPPGPQLCPPCYYTPREEQSTVCFMVYWLTASYLVT